jgi:hypothetical protein
VTRTWECRLLCSAVAPTMRINEIPYQNRQQDETEFDRKYGIGWWAFLKMARQQHL